LAQILKGVECFCFTVWPFRRTDIGKRSFSCYAAPATWNSLPPTVTNSDTLSVFKSTLKTHLFNSAHTTYCQRL